MGISDAGIIAQGELDWRKSRLPLYGGLRALESEKGERCLGSWENGRIAGIRFTLGRKRVLRLGYDLFREIAFLLETGQHVENAAIPAVEMHVDLVRTWMVEAGVRFLEIPPVPAGSDFFVALTHDIDFIGIRQHKFDHTMFGFLYRATVGAARDYLRGRSGLGRVFKCWRAAASLPFVYLGIAEDFWVPFEWYLEVEKGLNPTYFLIPFKGRCGEKLSVKNAAHRASGYGAADVSDWLPRLKREGCEVGVHGIDAWHSVERGFEERNEVASVAGALPPGIRMHWLVQDGGTPRVLEQAGYQYDSSAGYNDTVGYRNGTLQVFRPAGASSLLELPLHIQDGALFFPGKLNCSEAGAAKLCGEIINNARRFGGVLTLLWHDRSPGPERFWGEFYIELVAKLKATRARFSSGQQTVQWFRQRREVGFEAHAGSESKGRCRLKYSGGPIEPALRLRVYSPTAPDSENKMTDFLWDGQSAVEITELVDFGSPQHNQPQAAEAASAPR